MMTTTLKNREKSIVHEDMRLQRAIWTVERIVWCVMVLLVLLALLGAFSLGFLSRTEAASADGRTRIAYERILRNGRTHDFVVERSGLEQRAETFLTLVGFDFEAYTVEEIVPQPSDHRSGEGSTMLRFNAGEDGSLKVVIRIRPQRPGAGQLTLALPGEPPLNAGFFALP